MSLMMSQIYVGVSSRRRQARRELVVSSRGLFKFIYTSLVEPASGEFVTSSLDI